MHLGDFVFGVARVLDRRMVVPVVEVFLTDRDRRQLDVVVSDGTVHYVLWSFFTKLLSADEAMAICARIGKLSVFSVAHLLVVAGIWSSVPLSMRNEEDCLQRLPTDGPLRDDVGQVFLWFLDMMLQAAEAARPKKKSLIEIASPDASPVEPGVLN